MKRCFAIGAALLLLSGCVSTPGGNGLFVRSGSGTNTLYSLNPGVSDALAAGQQITQTIPGPWGAIGTIVFGGIATTLGLILRNKNKKASLVPVLIAGIEAGAHPETKAKVQQFAEAVGMDEQLATEVIKQTGS